jgi:ubiquitin carboxyl-terminal hydrolase 34
LIFHLKRFDFDLIDMRRTKINDHFEFPSEIDVSRYNVEHLSDPEKPTQEDMFDLVGVLVHQGNSENGHYYSFIRERPSPGHTQKWFDFNDRDVTDFEPSQIAYQAFGGIYDEHYQRQQKPFSAYMLFYQRKSAMDADHQKFISSPLSGPPKVPVPEMLEMEIAQDNESFVQEYCLYDPNHSRFIRQILSTLRRVNNGICSDDHEQETLALGIAIQHINQVISRMRDISIFDEIMVQLKKTIQGCAMCCNVAIHQICSNEQTLAGLLLRCPHMRIRAQIRTLLMDCLSHLRATDTTLYGADISDEDSETLVAEEDSALAIVTHQFGLLKYHLYLGTRGWDDYFNVFYQIARIGPLEGAAVLGNDMLAFSLRLFCMHAFPALKAENLTLWRYMEKRKGCFNQLIELIACLLACIDLDAELVDDHDERLSAFDKATQKFPLTREEHDLLFAWHDEHKAYATFDMMIEKFDVSKSEEFSPGRILKQALAVDDLNIRSRLYHTINEGINQVARPGNEPYVRAAIPFCEAATNQVDVIRIIRTVASDAASLSNQGGEAHADFFMHLPEIQNEQVAPCDRQPTFFYEQAITTSTKWGVGLLIYEDEAVRRNIANLLDHLLFRVHPARRDAREVKIIKFNSIRNLLAALCKRILHEYDQAMARSYIQTAFAMARTLAGVISEWRNTEEDFFSDADLVLLQHFSQGKTSIYSFIN